jgi:hypothetical protein
MPQISPVFWINLLSWMFAIFSLVIWFHQAISLPAILRIQAVRTYLLFQSRLFRLGLGGREGIAAKGHEAPWT